MLLWLILLILLAVCGASLFYYLKAVTTSSENSAIEQVRPNLAYRNPATGFRTRTPFGPDVAGNRYGTNHH